ncbi:hypothetical protein ZIOFF_052481 [Zingiber officinale]|uniref:Uncharacterized protein n=1 Tax=Zingiber officinale TaxID=94328 RepID=A0A8J5KSI2_ZINOF|nr:hypothetical protein ZIOFF_052481 [Zingiber officinale]
MAGIAILLDLWKGNPGLSTQSHHSYSLFSAAVAASAAAASISAGKPFASRAFFGYYGLPIAHCDAGASATWNEENISSVESDIASENIYPDSFKYGVKEYPIELKPLFSAFGLKSLAVTSLRSFLLFYLPLLEPRLPMEEDDDILHEASEEKPVDLVTPLQNSLKQIIRETAVVTSRRVLERFAVHRVSQRMAWKLLKGQLLAVAATWFVQVVIEGYRCFFRKNISNMEDIDNIQKFKLFRKKIFGTTIKCSASLVFASIGAGIGALFHPSTGQWIGCAIGDFAGPIVAIVCLEKLHLEI